MSSSSVKSKKANANLDDNSNSGRLLALPHQNVINIPSDDSSESDKSTMRFRKRKHHVTHEVPSKRRCSLSPSPDKHQLIAPIQKERLFPRPPWTIYSIWIPAWKFLSDDQMPSNINHLVDNIVKIVSASFSIIQGAILDGYQCRQLVRVFNLRSTNGSVEIDGLQSAPSEARASGSKTKPRSKDPDEVVVLKPPPPVDMMLGHLVSPTNTLVMFNSNASTQFHKGFTCVHISLQHFAKNHRVQSFIHASLPTYRYRFSLVESEIDGPVTICRFSSRDLPPPVPHPQEGRCPSPPVIHVDKPADTAQSPQVTTPATVTTEPPQTSTAIIPDVVDISTPEKEKLPSSTFDFQAWLQSGDFVPGPLRPKLEKAKDYVYHKLGELSSELQLAAENDAKTKRLPNMMIKRQCYTYGVVVLVPEVPIDRQQTTYFARISDETLKSILVRIHTTSKTSTLGPEIKVGHIIRLHRVNVQMEWDYYLDSTAMVLSTCPHHSYTLFEPGSESQIIFHTSAKSVTLSDFDKNRVGELHMLKSTLIGETTNESYNSPVSQPVSVSPADTIVIPRRGAPPEEEEEEANEPRPNVLHETPKTTRRKILQENITLVCQISALEYVPNGDTFKLVVKPIRADPSIPDILHNVKKFQDSDLVEVCVINGNDFAFRQKTLRMLYDGMGTDFGFSLKHVDVIGANPPYRLELNGDTCAAEIVEIEKLEIPVQNEKGNHPSEDDKQQNMEPEVSANQQNGVNTVELSRAGAPAPPPPVTPSSSNTPKSGARTPMLILTKLADPAPKTPTQVPVEKKALWTGPIRGRRPRLQHYQPETKINW